MFEQGSHLHLFRWFLTYQRNCGWTISLALYAVVACGECPGAEAISAIQVEYFDTTGNQFCRSNVSLGLGQDRLIPCFLAQRRSSVIE